MCETRQCLESREILGSKNRFTAHSQFCFKTVYGYTHTVEFLYIYKIAFAVYKYYIFFIWVGYFKVGKRNYLRFFRQYSIFA